MFCTKCGAQIDDDAAFCTKCGATVTPGAEAAARVMPPDASVTEVMGVGTHGAPAAGASHPGATPGQNAGAMLAQSPAPAYAPVAVTPAPEPQKKQGRGLIVGLVVVLVVALVAAGAFFFLSRDAGAVSIDESTFPDGTFRAYVLDNYDKDKDGTLSKGEIDAVTRMDLSQLTVNGYQPIRDLTGIDVFRNLEELDARNNDLSGEVDLSRNENLRHVDTTGNPNVTRVDVPEQTENVAVEPDTEVVHTPPLPAPGTEVPAASENDDGADGSEGSESSDDDDGSDAEMEPVPQEEEISADGPVYVLDSEVGSWDGGSSTYAFDRDSQGNLIAMEYMVEYRGEVESSCRFVYTVDEYGYTASCSGEYVNGDALWEEYLPSASLDNEVDANGRLTRCTMTNPGSGERFVATYTYYGDTDCLESVTYSDLEIDTSGPIGDSNSFGSWCPNTLPLADEAISTYSMEGPFRTYEIHFSQEGILQEIIVDGETVDTCSYTLDDFRNGIDEFDNGADWLFRDENGNIASSAVTYDFQVVSDYSYREVDSPSRAVSIFDRLYYESFYVSDDHSMLW